MFTGQRKFVSLTLSILLLLSLFNMTISAKGLIIEYDKPDVAIVIDVIDGEAIKVMHISHQASKPRVSMLRLIGVTTMANNDTYEYVKDQLLGKPVFILYDENNLPITDGFTNAYVFVNTDETLNETLLTYGYASLDKSFSNAKYYKDLETAELIAIRQEKGIHKISSTPSNIININLASSSILQEHFDISPVLASAIVNYRIRNPINDSKELGFIDDDIDRDFIIKHRASIHYTTNINDATLYELTSLFASSNGLTIAHDINRHRVFNPFAKVTDLKAMPSVSRYFTIIEPFITTTINDNLYVDHDNLVANINTASSSELVKASGMSQYFADKIVKHRNETAYVYGSLEELTKANFPLMNMNISGYVDNLTFITEINTAKDHELMSLFSSLDLSDAQKLNIIKKINYSKPFYRYEDIKSVIGSRVYDKLKSVIYIQGVTNTSHKATSVYTNINQVSDHELLSLHKNMTPSIVREIIEYRSYYPIYSQDELKKVLRDIKHLYLYQQIKDKIVFY